MIDTHTHLYDEAFASDFPETINRAMEAGVTHFIFPGTDSKEYDRMMAHARRYNNISVATGLHPTSVKANWKKELAFTEKTLAQKKWCAIGEIGIDGYWSKEYIKEQKEVLEQQMRWAAELDLPVIIHLRESQDVFFEVLDKLANDNIKMKGVLHAFTGSIETYRRALKYGEFKVGIGGVITYKKASIAETLKNIPLEKIILETDSPYLPPVPFRGKRNESAYIIYVAQKIAEIKNCEVSLVDKITTENAMKLFKITQ